MNQPPSILYYQSGKVKEEEWDEDRTDGPWLIKLQDKLVMREFEKYRPSVTLTNKKITNIVIFTFKIIKEERKLSMEKKHIKTEYYENGQVKSEKWNGPILIKYFESGQIQEEEWSDRTDGPFFIEYFESGQVKKEEWCEDITNGPILIKYFESGQVMEEEWYEDGTDGPILIKYFESGQVKKEEWGEDKMGTLNQDK